MSALPTLSELEIVRREKLRELRKMGINPYPAPAYEITHKSVSIKQNFKADTENNKDFEKVSLAGRIMSIRDMGKACFAVLQDGEGRIQVYIKKDDFSISEQGIHLYNDIWKKCIDIGDIIGIKGFVFTTKMGEISVHVKDFQLLSKALKPLPVVKEKDGATFDAVVDAEFRYRQRYVDLVINPHLKDVFIKRTKIYNIIRSYYNDLGYLEVETPVLQSIPGGANARPFITHHNSLDMELYLRIANELYLKRLIVGGFEGVYEFAKDFRNEGMDRTHNPEFTIMELYVAYKDYLWLMENTEQLLERIALTLYGTVELPAGEHTINFKAPYARVSIYEAIRRFVGADVEHMGENELIKVCADNGISIDPAFQRAKLIDILFSEKCEHHYVQPTFITDYPIDMSPLTKKHRSKEGLVERFELYVNGKELANAYSELNDPIDQYERFKAQAFLKQKGDTEAMYIDYDFLRALEYGMPPTAGIGIGMDRLVMLFTNQRSIQDVLFFPQMRSEKGMETPFFL